jgi:hypothetical protein
VKLKINTKKIQELKPCQDRLDNWLTHYKDFSEDIVDFLSLDKITPQDKIWVAANLLPRELLEVFAIDCAFAGAYAAADATAAAYAADAAAYAAAAADAAAYAADAAAYAADAAATAAEAAAYIATAAATAAEAAAYIATADAADAAATAAAATAAYAAERERQIDALIYLVGRWN